MKLPVILNYHKIEHTSDIGITTRRPEDFRNDLRLLINEGYEAFTFSQWTSNSLPENGVIITFDDAYQSFYKNALPSLNELDMKAVVYVPTAYIGLDNDWDVQAGTRRYRHMTENELREIAAAGHELGSHAHTHRFLNAFNDRELEWELRESAAIIEGITGVKPVSISYPFGKANSRVEEMAARFYQFGVKTLVRPHNGVSVNMALPRVNVYRFDSAETIMAKLDLARHRWVYLRDRLIGLGAWATIGLQYVKKRQSKNIYEFTG